MRKSKAELLEALKCCIEIRPNDKGIDCNACAYSCDWTDYNISQTVVCRKLLRDLQEYIAGSDAQETVFGISKTFIDSTMDFDDRDIDLSIAHEEMGELIQALSKYKRAIKDGDGIKIDQARKNIVEETVHVVISCGKLAKIFGITQEEIDAEVEKSKNKMTKKKRGLDQTSTYNIIWNLPIGVDAVGSRVDVLIKETQKIHSSERKVFQLDGALITDVDTENCCGEMKIKITISHQGKTYCFESVPYSFSEYFLTSIEVKP